MLSFLPGPGDELNFLGDVFVDMPSQVKVPVRKGRLLRWAEFGGDRLALVQTPLGQAFVRWSKIEGITAPTRAACLPADR